MALVVVSHVEGIAGGVVELVAQMAPDVTVLPAGGTDEGGIGTSFDRVLAALEDATAADADVVVLYDLGSALLTTESALELLDEEVRSRVRVVEAPLVEGSLAAAVAAQGGASLDEVAGAALGGTSTGGHVPDVEESRIVLRLRNPLGLHARPAASLARALTGLQAHVDVGRPGGRQVGVTSLLGVVGLALRGGDDVEVTASGPEAQQALERVRAMVEEGFGETTEASAGEEVEHHPPGQAEGVFAGTTASAGTATGPVRLLGGTEVALPARRSDPPDVEQARLDGAVSAAGRALGSAGTADVAAAHLALLGDPALLEPAARASRREARRRARGGTRCSRRASCSRRATSWLRAAPRTCGTSGCTSSLSSLPGPYAQRRCPTSPVPSWSRPTSCPRRSLRWPRRAPWAS